MVATMDEAGIAGQLAQRFHNALLSGDLDALAACYHSDIRVWHSTDGIEQTCAENLVSAGQFFSEISDRRIDDAWSRVFDDGFVQQHVLSGTAPDGQRLQLRCCVAARIAGGRIVRIDEWIVTLNAPA